MLPDDGDRRGRHDERRRQSRSEARGGIASRDGGGDLKTARELHFALFEVSKAIFFDTNPIPLKYMMKKLGIIAHNEHRLPMVPAGEALERRLDGVLEACGLL